MDLNNQEVSEILAQEVELAHGFNADNKDINIVYVPLVQKFIVWNYDENHETNKCVEFEGLSQERAIDCFNRLCVKRSN